MGCLPPPFTTSPSMETAQPVPTPFKLDTKSPSNTTCSPPNDEPSFTSRKPRAFCARTVLAQPLTVTVSPITDSGVTSTIDLTFLRGGAADIVVSAAPLRRRAANRRAAGRRARQLASNITRTPRISQQLLAALLLLADVH